MDSKEYRKKLRSENTRPVVGLTSSAAFGEGIDFGRSDLEGAPWDDPRFALVDPKPDIDELARQFDGAAFGGTLFFPEEKVDEEGKKIWNKSVSVMWSKNMHMWQGVTADERSRIRVSLSRPHLSRMGRGEVVRTLLHELIHAYHYRLGIVEDKLGDEPGDDHGPKFMAEKERVEKISGVAEILIYSSSEYRLPDEQAHIWECNKKRCRDVSPFRDGIFRNSINRGPDVGDKNPKLHKRVCNGE